MVLYEEILKGSRTSLAKGITLVESTLPEDEKKADVLIRKCLPHSGESIRVGVTGIPGVGKSTFIESFGSLLTKKGKKVAVLSIDPSSEKSRGSILGDKSRMNNLSANKNAFVRPSPSGGILGGVTNKTKECIILCEAAGYNVVLIETVGVGQSETQVSNLVDFFLLMMISGAGDELQGIKRGIMEMADAIIINKADGDNIKDAKITALAYERSLHLFPIMKNNWVPKVSICSAIEKKGINKVWEIIKSHNLKISSSGWKKKNRNMQNIYWLHTLIKEELGKKQFNTMLVNGKLKDLENELIEGKNIYQLLSKL